MAVRLGWFLIVIFGARSASLSLGMDVWYFGPLMYVPFALIYGLMFTIVFSNIKRSTNELTIEIKKDELICFSARWIKKSYAWNDVEFIEKQDGRIRVYRKSSILQPQSHREMNDFFDIPPEIERRDELLKALDEKAVNGIRYVTD